MTQSEVFKSAHALAKTYADIVGDYRLAFSYYVKRVRAENKKRLSGVELDMATVDTVAKRSVSRLREKMIECQRRLSSDDVYEVSQARHDFQYARNEFNWIKNQLHDMGYYSEGINDLQFARLELDVSCVSLEAIYTLKALPKSI